MIQEKIGVKIKEKMSYQNESEKKEDQKNAMMKKIKMKLYMKIKQATKVVIEEMKMINVIKGYIMKAKIQIQMMKKKKKKINYYIYIEVNYYEKEVIYEEKYYKDEENQEKVEVRDEMKEMKKKIKMKEKKMMIKMKEIVMIIIEMKIKMIKMKNEQKNKEIKEQKMKNFDGYVEIELKQKQVTKRIQNEEEKITTVVLYLIEIKIILIMKDRFIINIQMVMNLIVKMMLVG
ncbi:MAG: hypothetical protein EZS28_017779 [Streblomastix strix]|uniref:Uncharacterized protein n=1 Tax=Streblomastix strix TaxID=222440 RepID=A0A5J4VVI8_9EUKA|nr:MAG: hypothetical protein EZS28_017779 [Streblomastix strix]